MYLVCIWFVSGNQLGKWINPISRLQFLMNTTKKVGIAFAAILLGIVVSPAIPFNEAEAAKRVEISLENISNENTMETVKIVGLDNVSFAPNAINITTGDSILFLNVDGSDGGTDHTVTSAKIGTMERDGTFESGIMRVGESFKTTFEKPGVYEYFDSLHPTVPGKITVS